MKDMTIDQLKERREAIVAELDNPEADLNALHDEMRAINAELEARKEAEAKKAEIRAAVAEGVGETIESIPEERKETMSNEEIRNSKEYIDAYAEYIKSGDPAECRALLTTNAEEGGQVPVPEYVYDIVKTAWEREGIMSRVRKSYIKGNLKIGYEVSSTPAAFHEEGMSVAEEELILGVVNLVPAAIKKWISVSDEAMDLRGTAFLDYIYDELAYRIAKAAANALVNNILATMEGGDDLPPQAELSMAPAMGTVAAAIARLSDEAANPVIIMNKLTWSVFKEIQYANGYGADPFEGLTVLFNDSLDAYSSSLGAGSAYMIVGDLGQGALANFPNGNEITFKYDDLTLAHQDLVRIIGREFVALGVVAPNAFTVVSKA